MRRRKEYTNNFSAGELAEEYDQIGEDLAKTSLQSGQNVALLNSGGARRRPGSVRKASIAAEGRAVIYEFPGGFEILVFTNTKVYILDEDGVELDDLTGPWVLADIDTMYIDVGADRVDVASNSFMTRTLTRATDGTWTIAEFEFADGLGDGVRQPYFRYADLGVTLLPSALTGTVDIEFSAGVLTADFVGVRIRYLGQELEVATVVDGQNGTADVIQPLFPTFDVEVADASGFQVGEAVEGSETGVRGQVTAVDTGTDIVTVVMLEGYTAFDDSTPENLIGPRSEVAIVNVTSAAPAAVTIWDEAMIGPHRGYPAVVATHRKRKMFSGFPHPQAVSYLAASAIDRPRDFDVGTGEDDEAFVEGLGDDEAAEIRHLVSTEQLLVLTNRKAYYVPESENVPLVPTSVEFKLIGKNGASTVKPVLVNEGVIFIGTTKRAYAITPTGNVRASWRIVDLSELGYDKLTNPRELAVSEALAGEDDDGTPRPERYVYIRNSDGSLAVLMYKPGVDTIGINPWLRGGSDIWRSLAVRENSVFCIARVQNSWQLEQFDPARTMDGEVQYATTNTTYNGKTVHVALDGHVFDSGAVSAGAVAGVDPGADRTQGIDFALELIPMPPLSKYIGEEVRRISASVYFRNRGNVRVNGVLKSAYMGGDDLGAPPTLRSGNVREYLLGWREGNSVTVSQPAGEGAPMEVGSVTFVVVS